MQQVEITLKDGSKHINPYENLQTVQRVLGENIVSTKILKDGNEFTGTKINRKSLEEVAKRELKMHHKTMATLTDEELLEAIKKGN